MEKSEFFSASSIGDKHWLDIKKIHRVVPRGRGMSWRQFAIFSSWKWLLFQSLFDDSVNDTQKLFMIITKSRQAEREGKKMVADLVALYTILLAQYTTWRLGGCSGICQTTYDTSLLRPAGFSQLWYGRFVMSQGRLARTLLFSSLWTVI